MPIYKADGKKDGLQKYNVRINYTDTNGKSRQLTRTAYGKEAATDLLHKLTAEQKTKGDTPAKKMTIQQLFDEYVNVRQYEVRETSLDGTKRTIENHILPTLRDVRIDRLNASILQDWKFSMEKKSLAVSSKRNAFDKLKALLNYAVRREYIPNNPIMKIDTFKDVTSVKKEMDYYTAEEFKRFIETAKNTAQNKEATHMDLSEWDYYVFFNIAFYTGLRKGEILALKWSDIDRQYLSVKRSLSQGLPGADRETPPKNKSSFRTLQMPLPLINALDEHKRRQERLKDFSDDFRICGGEQALRNGTVGAKNGLYARLSEIKRIRIHDYRHSHASVLANEGINIQEVARRLGHSKIELTLKTYSHLYPREEERAVLILNGIV